MSFLRRTGTAVRAAAAAFLVVWIEFFAVPWRRVSIAAALLCFAVFLNPPLRSVLPGELGVRVNRLTGAMAVVPEGPVLVAPFVHALYVYSLRDQVYRPSRSARSGGEAPFQSVEGLSIGMEMTVRYALDPERIAQVARRLPRDVGRDLIEPVVDGVLYRTLSRFTVKEIFSEKRAELQRAVETELREALAKDGVTVRSVFVGNVDLPPQYRQGMESMLAEELATQKMKYTLELKEKEVKETELAAEGQKIQRQKQAESEAQAQVIAAKGQAEAIKHVLPFKQKEIQQRKLEAQARKQTRVMDAESDAEARKIESSAEADSRRRLADADAYRIDVTGKSHSEQMARESHLIAENPLLIEKALADKLSDKIQVIVASPESAGSFLTGGLVGMPQRPQLAKAGGQ
jgi:regulator of protease activity HflC (stomatin/prohibitin superfamily)